jgi:hypothetical protein
MSCLLDVKVIVVCTLNGFVAFAHASIRTIVQAHEDVMVGLNLLDLSELVPVLQQDYGKELSLTNKIPSRDYL